HARAAPCSAPPLPPPPPPLDRHLERVAHLLHPELVRRRHEDHDHCRAHGAEPDGLPPGWGDEDRQRHSLFIPYAIAVRSLDVKDVVARVRVRVGGEPLAAVDLVTARVEVFESVSST